METESLHIHLVSNVAPALYPNNNPSNFFTPLAEEIELHGDNWEVGVTNVINPSHIQSTTSVDEITFRKLIKYEEEVTVPDNFFEGIYKPYQEKIKFLKDDARKDPKDKAVAYTVKILKRFNSAQLVKGKKISLSYDGTKFVLQVHFRECLFMMSTSLARALGFHQNVFSYGKNVATYLFAENYNLYKKSFPTEETLTYYCLRRMSKSFQGNYEPYSHDELQPYISAGFDYRNVDNNTFSDLQVRILPINGEVVCEVEYDVEDRTKNFEMIQFDKRMVDKLSLPEFMCISRNFTFYTPGPNRISMRHNLNVESKKIEKFMYDSRRFFMDQNEDLQVKVYDRTLPASSVFVNTSPITKSLEKKSFKTAAEFLPVLNRYSAQYKYDFTYTENPLRFHLKCDGDYCLQLSPSLASVLGFSNPNPQKALICPLNLSADKNPFLHRGIDTIFVYCDIVEPVLVGDVKVPLLVYYPYKTNEEGYNAYTEFLMPTYVGVNRSTLRTIEVQLRDATGECIPFAYGKTVITLHLRRKTSM